LEEQGVNSVKEMKFRGIRAVLQWRKKAFYI